MKKFPACVLITVLFCFILQAGTDLPVKPVKTGSTVSASGKKWDVVISFISTGNGIDNASYEKIESYIKSHPKKIKYEVIRKGREGEKNICVKLKGLKKEEKEVFIEDVNKLIGNPELVKVEESTKTRSKF